MNERFLAAFVVVAYWDQYFISMLLGINPK